MDIFTLTCDKLPTDTRVMVLSGSEGLSQPFSFTLDLVIPGDEGLSFGMEEAMDAPATLEIHDGAHGLRSTFHGILSRMDWVQEVAHNAVYRVTLVPRLWRLGLNQHSNVFVDKPVTEIVKSVLEANGLKEKEDFDFLLGPTKYEKLPQVTQYQESDLAFISRRLERDGLYYFFEHDSGRDKLIITDSLNKHTSSGSVRYFPQATHETMGIEALTAFTCRQLARPRQVKVDEFNYLQTDMQLRKSSPVASHGTGDVVSHDENYETPQEGQRLVQVRAEELEAREVVFVGEGRTSDVRPGFTFEVTSHPRPSFNAAYLAVAVTHEGSQGVIQGGKQGTEAAPPTYLVRFEAIPSGVQYRPGRLTPVPRIYGTEMAFVDGEQESPYAQIDKHGRYKVQLFLDEKKPGQGKASMWVRMLQPHGGPNEGFHFPLRKKTEVLLVFLGGDPDRPVIAGMVPNQQTPSPVTEDNATQNVILTGGGSRIEIEDNDGAQYIRMTTPPESTLLHLGAEDGSGYNVHLSSMGKALAELGGDLDIRVDGHKTEEVALDVTETYKSKQETTVDSDHKVEVKGKEDYKVHGNQKIEVVSNREVKVTGNQKHQVTGNDEVKVTGNQTVQITSNQDVQVMGNQTQQVTGNVSETITGNHTETVTGNLTETVTGPVTQTHAAAYTHTVTGTLTQTILGGATITSPAGYNVIAPSNSSAIENFKVDTVLGIFIETIVGLKLATHIGPSIEYTAALKLGKRGISLSSLDVEVKNAGPRLENAAIWLGCAGITLFP